MKKFFMLFLATCISIGAVAQMGKVALASTNIDQGLLDKAKESIDLALVNEKSKDNPKTYATLGRLCQECFKSENPKFKALYPNALEDAYAAYQKALELDKKGGTAKQFKLANTYFTLGNDFLAQGIKKFELKDYEGALNSFEFDIKVRASDVYIGAVDTGVYFNAGLAAYNGKMWDKAIPHFQKCIEMKYEKTLPYILLYTCYAAKGDNVNGEQTLQKAFEGNPDNQDVLLQLVDFYMKNDKVKEAFSYINIAKSKDANNFSLFWAEGVLYMKQENYDEAIKAFTRSIELKPDLYDTQFNLGVCFYNKAVAMMTKANEIMDPAAYKEAAKEANMEFIKAIPYFEKAYSINAEELDALKNLKELYFRLRNVSPEYEAKYNEVVKKLEGK